ncbi:MAG: triose-phosphate isomerase [Planctomycetaceae bacterium]|jgi:triosephosphate isomerase (TIM)|nr:triose-phosphate isomerase [Planctomycetaceae bacterium]
MRKIFIAGNWKMNLTRSGAVDLTAGLVDQLADNAAVDVAICPSSGFLSEVASQLASSAVALGAQNLYPAEAGAYTGELNAEMLIDLGCTYVILGHSERRHLPDLAETNEFINLKVRSAIAAGLKPILCVGELLEERNAGQTTNVVENQLAKSLADISIDDMETVTIAYEPVWAIGTGKVATPDQAELVHSNIREWLRIRFNDRVADTTRIQYGGSVKPENARELLSQPNIDGALVGGAALSAESFTGIIKNA